MSDRLNLDTLTPLRRRVFVSPLSDDEIASTWRGLHLPAAQAEERQRNLMLQVRKASTECVEWAALQPGRRVLVRPFRWHYVGRDEDDVEVFVVMETDIRAIILTS